MSEQFKDGILSTNSVASKVIGSGGEDIGDVMLCDYDAAGKHFPDELNDLPGITLILESSKDRYHVWNLTVRSVEATALAMLNLHGDALHIPVGFRRGYWRIRIGPKKRSASDIYKKAPELVSIIVNETRRKQSKPHWKIARAAFGAPEDLPIEFEWAGEGLDVVTYQTLTDEMKLVVGDD